MKLELSLIAGRYDGDERNIKYADSAATLEEAFDKLRDTYGYDFAEIEVREVGSGGVSDFKYVIDLLAPQFDPLLRSAAS